MKKFAPFLLLLLLIAAGVAAYAWMRPAAAPSVAVDAGLDDLLPKLSGSAVEVSPIVNDRVPQSARLDLAIAELRPSMKDLPDRLDEGTARLVVWAAAHLDWAQLDALTETSAALFRRDPDQERGRKICLRGVLREIRAEQNIGHRLVEDSALPLLPTAPTRVGAAPALGSIGDAGSTAGGSFGSLAGVDDRLWAVPRGKVYFSLLIPPQPKEEPGVVAPTRGDNVVELEAIAVRSGGTLVDGSSARFCGVLTGVTSTATTASDHRLRHRAVGMFDLPENRGSAEVSAAPSASAAPSPSALPSTPDRAPSADPLGTGDLER